jgi:enoyl-CoA hydratase/carnithine racemase
LSSEPTGGGTLAVDEPAPGVGRLTIANPAKRNALDRAILDAFARTLPELDHRCLIVTGQGTIFSAGYDIGDLPAEPAPAADGAFAHEAEELVAQPFEAAVAALTAYPYPTLAALPGLAIGGGLELALACDLRLAAERATFAMPPARLGLVYSHTGIRRFIEVVGAARTRELFLVGRRVDAPTALRWGLVHELHAGPELERAALALAGDIAGNAPLALRANKRVIDAVLAAGAELDPALEAELVDLRRACFFSEDFREGVRAFAQKRPPRWRGR